ncbi:hypothetical protein EIP91_011335 [Steccherinum ochraceum]|uniref:Tyr recombinase domain-containing protein n=1 Tax=Steccherinum ochraceum TaxID=92696 RepID=A0A4R0R7K7_9APHY|nr:hypothetical protein EIP91_011335 [Steccherinum ochraceum]
MSPAAAAEEDDIVHHDPDFNLATVTAEECDEQLVQADLEESDSYVDNIDMLMDLLSLKQFKTNESSHIGQVVSEVVHAHIKDKTRDRHSRIAKSFIDYHLQKNPKWDPRRVTEQSPQDVCEFIMQKCGDPKDGPGFQGLGMSTAVAARAALTLWFTCLQGDSERTDEWRQDTTDPNIWHGLPTRSRYVSRFMVGLGKKHAKAGKMSQSVRATLVEDIFRFHDHCLNPNQTMTERRRGIVRYCAYLLAFLMMLRVNEVLSLTFEGVENLPGERDKVYITLGARKTTTHAHTYTLFAKDDEPRLCPKRMLILLGMVYGKTIRPTGLLFRKINNSGHATKAPLTTAVLHRSLMTDLQALGYTTWALYGTHSFRRGGCQFRIKVQGWAPDAVAAWGGWSQLEAVTMYRYFYSPNDNHEYMAEYDRNYPKRVCMRLFASASA